MKGKKPATARTGAPQFGRSAPKAGKDKGKATKRAPEPHAAPTVDDIEEAAAIAQNAYNQANPKPAPESLASRAAKAARAAENAAELRGDADMSDHAGHHERAQGDRIRAALEQQRADSLAVLPAPIIRGPGGEVALASPGGPWHNRDYHFRDTLEEPNITSAAASRARMEQASGHGTGGTGTDSLVQALDAAETLGASNSLEKMAAHQLAICHGAFMDLMRDGASMIRERKRGQTRNGSEYDAQEFFTVEGCRLLTTATRLMTAYQNGLATLARVRQGGRQVVTVQHVQVNDGGQAVVAGNVAPRGVLQGGEKG